MSQLKISSIGASVGVHGGIKVKITPDLSKVFNTSWVLWILELSSIIIQFDTFISKSYLIHNRSLVRNQETVLEIFLDDKGDANHCPEEAIAVIIDFDPLNYIFSNFFDTPFLSQE